MKSLVNLSNNSEFIGRHIGVCDEDKTKMLESLGYKSIDSFISAVVPKKILLSESLDLDDAITETEALDNLGIVAKKIKY